ncbi:MAG TPA: alpha/beta hydrolase domain-containing protein [Casimicrobiaceae bacterium]|nr:alpha/beta hydrolase domain-containing protein [Casimicrobiaceae bacterium]
MRNVAFALLVVASLPPVEARIVEVDVKAVTSFADGHSFGNVGAYQRVSGVAKGELDPSDPRNRIIVNLDRAPRNAGGKVEYEVDFDLLRPADASRGNHRLIFDVTNRGRKFLLHWLLDAPAQAVSAVNDPKSLADAGNRLFFEMGYTMAWTGWDPDAPRTNQGMSIRVPVATHQGQPIVQRIRDELVSGTRGAQVERFRLAYESATLDQAQASLTVRRRASDPPQVVAASGWAYIDSRTIKLLPDGTKPEPGSLYDFHYPAKNPQVLGVGFAATRDFVSFLRHGKRDDKGNANPAGGSIDHTLAIGISQSGRYLRDHLALGFNQDESKRKVFDGVLAHISGVGRVFMNEPFGMPARTNTQHEDHSYPENAFPFAAATMRDPHTGKSGSLLRHDGFDPLLIEVNTSTEYWQKGASLLHTDPLGAKDATLSANARVYLVAGTQHGGRVGLTTAAGPCVNPRNPHSPAPALRALMIALDRWVVEGVAPPPSRVPTLASQTLVASTNSEFPRIPGFIVARSANEIAPFGNWVDPKADAARAYHTRVAKVDADGNEIAGIRLPEVAVPLGTYTGWNLYKAPFPEGALCDRDGSYSPFAATRAEREAKGDPRLSLEERYGTHENYVAAVRTNAAELARQRLLLPSDAGDYIARAKSDAVGKLFMR